MNLIPINVNKNDEQYVSGRALHMFLEIETPYPKWFSRMCEYGFTENIDFKADKNVRVQLEGNRNVSREVIDHNLTIEMAKQLCMLARNDGRLDSKIQTKWTQKGRLRIHEILTARGIQAVCKDIV